MAVQARSLKAAERKFESEAFEYARGDEPLTRVAESTAVVLHDAPGAKVVEIASMMRVTKMSPARYVAAFCSDLRPSSCDAVGWRHVWHNHDGGSSNCYNCNELRPGQRWAKRKRRGA